MLLNAFLTCSSTTGLQTPSLLYSLLWRLWNTMRFLLTRKSKNFTFNLNIKEWNHWERSSNFFLIKYSPHKFQIQCCSPLRQWDCEVLVSIPDSLFVEFWGESVPKEKRIARWLERADALATKWVPSQVLFLGKSWQNFRTSPFVGVAISEGKEGWNVQKVAKKKVIPSFFRRSPLISAMAISHSSHNPWRERA